MSQYMVHAVVAPDQEKGTYVELY